MENSVRHFESLYEFYVFGYADLKIRVPKTLCPL
jgi:hypothetical protein